MAASLMSSSTQPTDGPFSLPSPPPSNLKAATWMAGWLALMLTMAVAGRETTRELHVFQIMEMRSIIGLVMLYPMIHLNGGLAAMRTPIRGSISPATSPTTARSSAGSWP
jgi:hypothetical protein